MGSIPAKDKIKKLTLDKYYKIYELKVFKHWQEWEIKKELNVSERTIFEAVKYVNDNFALFENEDLRNMYLADFHKDLKGIEEKLSIEKSGMNYSKLVEAKMKVMEKIMFLTGFSEKKGDTINNINGNVIIKREFHIHINKPNGIGTTSTETNSGYGDQSKTGDSPILPS